jgi:hypothetical protein
MREALGDLLAANERLSDKLWSGYAAYVIVHCPKKTNVPGDFWELDEMALELFDLAQNYETHGTF